MLSGIVVSPGLALGPAVCLFELDYKEILEQIHQKVPENSENEIQRFLDAQRSCLQVLQANQERASQQSDPDQAMLFKAHSLLLSDEVLLAKIIEYIQAQASCAEEAVSSVFQLQITQMQSRKNQYLKERVTDLETIRGQLLSVLLKLPQSETALSIEAETKPYILVVKNLTPNQLVKLRHHAPLAILSQEGSRTSHAAIMARSLGIPSILGIPNLSTAIKTGDYIFVNALENFCDVSPSETAQCTYQQQIKIHQANQTTLKAFESLPARTLDDHSIAVLANLAHPDEVEKAVEQGIEGVGLFRTEFLFMGQSQAPTQAEQAACYASLVKRLPNKLVTIRTLDIGGDKPVEYIPTESENNPFLGLRGIRLCLAQETIFRTQLKAICQAAASGKIQVMLPMVSCLEEWFAAKTMLNEIQSELEESEHLSIPDRITMGIMVETPAAVLMAEQFAQEVDFFSVGTNDLVQYITAVDRTNKSISHLYQPFSPAVLRALNDLITVAHSHKKTVCLCGEMGSDRLAIPLLIGLNFDSISMNPFFALEFKKIVRSLRYADTQQLVQEALHARTSFEVESILKEFQTRQLQ